MISTWNLYCSETKTNVPLWVFKWVFQNLIIEKAIARIHEYIRGQQMPQIIHSYQNYWLEHYLMYVSSHTCRYMHICLVFSLKLLIDISPSILPLSSWSLLQVTEGTGCTLIASLSPCFWQSSHTNLICYFQNWKRFYSSMYIII